MNLMSGLFEKEQRRFWGVRLLLCAATVLIYFTLWRPVRVAITEQLVYPQIQYFEASESVFTAGLEAGALVVRYEYGETTKQLSYRPEFGFFFLTAILALLFVTNRKKHFGMLLGFHLVASLVVYFLLILGASITVTGFLLADAINGYMMPALTLAFVPLVVDGKL